MNIGIIGIGLMGSSLAQALKAARPELCFLVGDSKESHLETARKMQLGALYTTDIGKVAAASDILFIATPVRSMGAIAAEIGPILKEGAIVSDLGSVKGHVIKEVEPHIPEGRHFVPGHPVAGLERAGPEHGAAALFDGRSWILTPTARTDRAALESVRTLLSSLNLARIIDLDPETHDRILGFTSHLPHVIAFAAMLESARLGETLGVSMPDYNGGSYDDMTRVAAADRIMWRDIFLTNGAPITAAIRGLIDQMEGFLAAMAEGDEAALSDLIDRARTLKILSADRRRGKTAG